MKGKLPHWSPAAFLLSLVLVALSSPGLTVGAQASRQHSLLQATPTPVPTVPLPGSRSRTFPETGKTVRGIFLDYWERNGGLAQQGYPISEIFGEVSPLDGKAYTVQYFERAVFEYHPENPAPYDVLLSQLGAIQYNRKYPNGAPGQQPNNTAGSRLFGQTGKRVGGPFLAFWERNGGLAQQGYPISEEFMEKSDLDGETYRVQYFERAVFELHPELQAPNNVLLSQLGTFRLKEKYPNGPPVAPTAPPPTPGTGGNLPAPTGTPVNPACAGIPANQNMTITPNCGSPRQGFRMAFEVRGFRPGESVRITATTPAEMVLPMGNGVADAQGVFKIIMLVELSSNWPRGLYTAVAEGATSGIKGTGYFKIIGASNN